jgi:HK97 family phage major capsid protein
MAKLIDLQERRNKLMNDAALLIRKEGITKEDRTAADAMLADVDVLETDIARETRVAKFEADQRSFVPPARDTPGTEAADAHTPAEKAERQKKAYRTFIQYGMDAVSTDLRTEIRSNYGASARELRDLGVSTPTGAITGGGQFVPQAFYPILTEAQLAYGALLSIVRTIKTDNGASMKMSLSNDTGNGLTIIGEAVAPAELDPTLNFGMLSTSMATTGVIKVSLQELQDSAFNIDEFIKNNFGRRYFRSATNLVTNGATNVQSIISAATTGANSVSPTAVGYADIAALSAALDPAYELNATWTLNSKTRGYLIGITDTLGRPLFVPNPSSGAFDMLLGKPVVINQSLSNIPTVAGSEVPIQYGDFNQGYLFRQVQDDLSIIRLNERYMDTLEVGFIGFARIGGISTDAGTHPILNLVCAG